MNGVIKTKISSMLVGIVLVGFCFLFSECADETTVSVDADATQANINNIVNKPDTTHLPWNVSIFLDLSDRIDKDAEGGVKQFEHDIELLNMINKLFYVHNWNSDGRYGDEVDIYSTQDILNIIIHPVPDSINNLIKSVKVDYSSIAAQADKYNKGMSAWKTFEDSIPKIYSKAIPVVRAKKQWGSDLYGFFMNKCKSNCIKTGYRNILIILTDGQVYYNYNSQHKEFNDRTANYMTYNTLNKRLKLHVETGMQGALSNLEILVLELYANGDATRLKQYKETLSQWFNDMGISKYEILEADLPTNNKVAIENFFAE